MVSLSGKKSGLQRRIRLRSPFNIYINCRSHCLALYSSYLMNNPDIGELLPDYDALHLGLWNIFHYSQKKGTTLENIPLFMARNH